VKYRIPSLVVTAAVVLAAAAAPAAEAPQTQPTGALVTRLRGKDHDQAEQALKQLLARGEAGKKTATGVLKDLLRRRALVMADAHRRLSAQFRLVGDPARMKALAAAMDRHEAAAAELMKFAFDNKRYPVPAKASTGWLPGRDYQKGQVLLEGRAEVAFALSNKLESQVAGAFGWALRARRPGGAGLARDYLANKLTDSDRPMRVLKYDLVDPVPAWVQIGMFVARWQKTFVRSRADYGHARAMAAKVGLEADDKTPELPELVTAIGVLFSGDLESAARHRPADAAGARIFDFVVRRYVMIYNARAGKRWSRREKQLLRRLNLIRLGANLPPLVANDKLHAAAREHSTWQNRNRKMSHSRPEKDKRTVYLRCRAQGYRAGACENVSHAAGAIDIWLWRTDAGHHRILLLPRIRAAGIGQAGTIVTYDGGWLIENEPLARLLNARR